MLEGLIIGVFSISLFGFLYSVIRPYFKARVNCWFCNENQWVPYKQRNSFKCLQCQQYNGFNESGDYNRRIPQMFTEAANAVSSAIRAATFGPKVPAANGLCDTCNKLQSVLMERLHKFEARDENNYFDEYEEYKHRLDQQYPLCERCEAYTMQKLRLTQANYVTPAMSTASGFARPPPSSSGSSKASSVRGSPLRPRQHDHATRRRKLFFATGAKTISATLLNAFASLILFIAFYETTPAELPFHIAPKHVAEHIVPLAPAIAAGSTGAFFFGFKSSKSRITFLDLLGSVAWPIFTMFCLLDSSDKYDFHLLGTYMSIFLCILSVASLLVPRKRKHLKRPNTIYSAFSIASTPMSQCSSRFTASRANLSVLPDDVSGSAEDEPMDTDNVPDFNLRDNHSLFVGSTPSSKRSKAYLQYRERREMSSREGTPAREINTGLDRLNLDDVSFSGNFGAIDADVDEVRSTRSSILSPKALTPSKTRVNSPFSSMTFNSNVRQTQPFSSFNTARSTATGTVFSGVTARTSLSSKFSSVSSPNNRLRAVPKAPLSFAAPSEFTSVSQQRNTSNVPTYLAWMTAIVALLALIIQTVYIFFYHQPVVVISPDAAGAGAAHSPLIIPSSTAD